MRTICAWCKKVIRDDENAKADDPVSHGICVACKREVDKEFEELKRQQVFSQAMKQQHKQRR